MFEFHISRYARDKYRFDQLIFGFNGNAILADFAAARSFAQKMNDQRDLVRYPEQAVRAGDINAMGLIDEILHAIVAEYRTRVNPGVFHRALENLYNTLGKDVVQSTLAQFTGLFPPVVVYDRQLSVNAYLSGITDQTPHTEIALEELVLLWMSNANPAFRQFDELFNDQLLEDQSAYRKIIDVLERFFTGEPGFGPRNSSILDVLRMPARQHPDSLFSQLEYLLGTFSSLLTRYNFRLLRSLDLLREESKPGFTGPGPAEVLEFQLLASEEEPEKFSPDSAWMPKLILIAKNTYVWLDQLSSKYGREIRRLDQIPREELEQLAAWGFSGLWLIGLWERSTASRAIKHLTGNTDAVSSAYSLFDYQIAADLGGDAAYEGLRERARACGLLLAADMVPNHTGIYSKWVLEHPEWFISLDYPPYPSYSFNGANLSPDPNIGIYLEDHYYERTDAAVVFKRVDFNTGRTHYIYHGNDGTSMPWNDTAQLNYLNAEAREAVIQTILNVARKFPIIRFDAAMTLAKKHIQRLWYPEPGHGGAIPSRAEHSLPKMRFDELIPNEFWREVVDRVAKEVPDTLLLAEAFWMMEGYFVRSLGMHRVYNSAFMNMLRDEKNAEYRAVIKNTIEFDPEILKRYVNFMNNPDEETAIEQFGDGGKYFGICVLMSTLPGLPMFGHGQVEGFKEKYGMEYQRAYFDETPNLGLIARHEHEIFPLLHHRALFSNVDHFQLYDLHQDNGTVNEDVYAYSNQSNGEASLVLFHNKWGDAQGTIHHSSPIAVKHADGSTSLETRSLATGLGLPNAPSKYVIFRDQISNLEYIRSCAEIHDQGLTVQLGAFAYNVFLDFRIVDENEWSHYRMIMEYLNGRGVYDLEAVKQELILQPLLEPWKRLVNPGFFDWIFKHARQDVATTAEWSDLEEQVREKMMDVFTGITSFMNFEADEESLAEDVIRDFRLAVGQIEKDTSLSDGAMLLSWVFARSLGKIRDELEFHGQSRAWVEEWLFNKFIDETLDHFAANPYAYALTLLLIGKSPDSWLDENGIDTMNGWLKNGEIARFLGVNRHQGVLWYDRGALEQLLKWVDILSRFAPEEDSAPPTSKDPLAVIKNIREASLIAGFQVKPLLTGLAAND